MKRFFKISIPLTLFVGGFAALLYAMISSPAYAAANVYFAPGGATVTRGQSFTVNIYGSAPSNLGAPSTNVAVRYPGSLLSVVGISKAGSVIPGGSLSHNTSAKTVSINDTRIGYSAAINNKKLFSITFRAIASGTAQLNFASTFFNGHTVAGGTGTYSIANPRCPSGQIGTWPNCRNPPKPKPPAPKPPAPKPPVTPWRPTTPAPANPTPKPTPKKKATPKKKPSTSKKQEKVKPTVTQDDPAIEDVQVRPGYDTAVVDWKTNRKANKAVLEYGTDPSNLTGKMTVTISKSKKELQAKLSGLQLGTQYFYAITVTLDKQKNPVVERGNFMTNAYPVTLKVSRGGQPFAGGTIQINGFQDTHTTDDKGEVQLSLTPNDYTFKVSKDDVAEEQSFTVKAIEIQPGATPDTQVVTVDIPVPEESTSFTTVLIVILSIILALLGIGAAVWFFLKKRRENEENSEYQPMFDDFSSNIGDSTPTSADTTQQQYDQSGNAISQDQGATAPYADPYSTANAADAYSSQAAPAWPAQQDQQTQIQSTGYEYNQQTQDGQQTYYDQQTQPATEADYSQTPQTNDPYATPTQTEVTGENSEAVPDQTLAPEQPADTTSQTDSSPTDDASSITIKHNK